jgi:hypothetical protein
MREVDNSYLKLKSEYDRKISSEACLGDDSHFEHECYRKGFFTRKKHLDNTTFTLEGCCLINH